MTTGRINQVVIIITTNDFSLILVGSSTYQNLTRVTSRTSVAARRVLSITSMSVDLVFNFLFILEFPSLLHIFYGCLRLSEASKQKFIVPRTLLDADPKLESSTLS